MRIWNPWFDWLSFLVGLVMSAAAWGAVRDFWRGERDFRQAVLVGSIYVVLALPAFWISLRLGRNQKRMREWRWDEKHSDVAKE